MVNRRQGLIGYLQNGRAVVSIESLMRRKRFENSGKEAVPFARGKAAF